MRATYFKAKTLDIFILVCFKNGKIKQEGALLDEIKFFWKEAEVLSYIEKHNLEKIDKNLLEEKGVVSDLIYLIKGYLNGEKINLYDNIKNLNIDLSFDEKFHSSFSNEVMKIVAQLQYGETTSYSSIANKMNSKAYRAIGTVLSKNPIPLIIPCHRVIGKNGIGGFMGKSNDGEELILKKILLEIEGVVKY